MSERQNQFTEGAEVVIFYGRSYDASYRLTKVHKVHKSGRFTLAYDPRQQWSPDSDGVEARESGRDVWSRSSCYLLTGPKEATLRERMQTINLQQRFLSIRHRLEEIKKQDATVALVEALEAAVTVFEREKAEREEEAKKELAAMEVRA